MKSSRRSKLFGEPSPSHHPIDSPRLQMDQTSCNQVISIPRSPINSLLMLESETIINPNQNHLSRRRIKQDSSIKSKELKTLDHCCVIASTSGHYRPMLTVFKRDQPKLFWEHFRGYTQSPFEFFPNRIDDYFQQLTKKKEIPLSFIIDDIEGNFCEICRTSFIDPNKHHESDLHKKRASLCNWEEMDNIFAIINAQNSEF